MSKSSRHAGSPTCCCYLQTLKIRAQKLYFVSLCPVFKSPCSLKEEIEDADRKFMDLFVARNFNGMSELYTEDCKVMPTGSSMLEGRAAAAKLFQSVHDSGCEKVKLVEEEVGSAGGDVIYSRGLYTFYLEDGTEADSGKFVVLWKRVDGVLHFYIDIFNSSKS